MRTCEEKIYRGKPVGMSRWMKFAKVVTVLYFCITNPEPNL